MTDTMQALADRGRYVGEEDPGYYVIESITVGADGTTAEVVSCWRLTGVLYGPPVDHHTARSAPTTRRPWSTTHPGSVRQTDQLVLGESGVGRSRTPPTTTNSRSESVRSRSLIPVPAAV